MTIIDPIGDMFTRIRNGQMRNLISVVMPASKFRSKILDILKSEGYIINYIIESIGFIFYWVYKYSGSLVSINSICIRDE